MRQESPRRLDRLDLFLAAALFALALLPRTLDLATFLTVDEPAWAARSARFAQALLSGDLAGTFQTNHPGVVTMWTGAAGLAGYHALAHPGPPGESFSDLLARVSALQITADMLPALRWPTGLLAAGCVALTYWLLRKTFSRPTALLAGVLIALDPFFLAHSRILHHDALATLFTMVSLVAAMTYLLAERKWGYLALSGAAGALAWLSKASALFMGPWVLVLFGLVYAVEIARSRGARRRPLAEGARGLLIWGAAAGLTTFVAWPALWGNPLGVSRQMLSDSAELAESGHLQYFLGKVMTDPGPLFYPVVLLFRATPLTLVGLGLSVAVLIGLLVRLQAGRAGGASETGPDGSPQPAEAEGERAETRRLAAALGLYLLFIAAFLAFITLSPKKQDRYLLPLFPVVDVCAAAGLVGAAGWVAGWVSAGAQGTRRGARWAVAGLALAAMLFMTAWYHPYYLSAYNPLAGGAAQAQRSLLVGWGEGMNLAGEYLNGKAGADGLTAAAVPFRTLVPYFRGTATSYLTGTAPALAADYVVAYVSQAQRQGPDVRLWEFLRDQEPEATIRLHGLDYAWIYPGPRYLSRQAPASLDVRTDGRFGDRLALLGYNARPVTGTLDLELFWQALAALPEDYTVSLRLLDAAGHRWVQQEGGWANGLLPTTQFPPGQVLRDRWAVPLPPGLPAGRYALELYVYSPPSSQNLPVGGQLGPVPVFGLRAGPVSLPKQAAAPGDVAPQHPLDLEAAEGLSLLGYDLPAEPGQPGGMLSPVLYWTARAPIGTDYGLRLVLQAADGSIVQQVERPLGGGGYPTRQWRPGDAVKDWQDLPIPPETPPGAYRLGVAVTGAEGAGQHAPIHTLGEVRIEGRPHRFDPPERVLHPARANFADQIEWLGYDLDASRLKPGETAPLTLYWRALSPMATGYKVFAHLLGPDGRMAGQRDAVPGAGAAPTTGWVKGEVISDTLDVPLAPGGAGGPYRLAIGWYDAATGQRLPVVDERGQPAGDHVEVGVE